MFSKFIGIEAEFQLFGLTLRIDFGSYFKRSVLFQNTTCLNQKQKESKKKDLNASFFHATFHHAWPWLYML